MQQAKKDQVRAAKVEYSRTQRDRARGWQEGHDDALRHELVERMRQGAEDVWPDDDGSGAPLYSGAAGAQSGFEHHQHQHHGQDHHRQNPHHFTSAAAVQRSEMAEQDQMATRMLQMVNSFQPSLTAHGDGGDEDDGDEYVESDDDDGGTDEAPAAPVGGAMAAMRAQWRSAHHAHQD